MFTCIRLDFCVYLHQGQAVQAELHAHCMLNALKSPASQPSSHREIQGRKRLLASLPPVSTHVAVAAVVVAVRWSQCHNSSPPPPWPGAWPLPWRLPKTVRNVETMVCI